MRKEGIMLGIMSQQDMRELALPHLREGEVIRQVFAGNAKPGLHWTAKVHVFIVTDQRSLVLGKKEGLIAELPRSMKFIPAKAGRFDLAKPGGLAGLTSFTATYSLPQYHEKVMFGATVFSAMLAADGREGERHSLAAVRILH
jgi:hypothetical protein